MKYLLFFLFFIPNLLLAQCPVGGQAFSSQAQIDDFRSQFPNCQKVNGDLRIVDGVTDDITSLTNLLGIDTIMGNLEVSGSDRLKNFFGLDSLKFIDGSLIIRDNDSLSSISNLGDIGYLGNNLEITFSDELLSLEGLNWVDTIRGNFIINRTAVPDLLPIEGLKFVEGDCRIFTNVQLQEIDGLNSLTNIGGMLSLSSNFSLKKLSGLSGLSKIGGGLFINANDSLGSITGFNSLDSIGAGLEIAFNDSLSVISGFLALVSVGGEFDLKKNDLLIDATGFSSLNEIGQSFILERLPFLANTDDFTNLTKVNGGVFLFQLGLSDISGLAGIDPSGMTNLNIISCPQLNACSLPNFCEFIGSGGSTTIDSNNGMGNTAGNQVGCQNIIQIADNCPGITVLDSISGTILNTYGIPTPGVIFSLFQFSGGGNRLGNSVLMDRRDTTDELGAFVFPDVENFFEYRLGPVEADIAHENINQADLNELQAHLDGQIMLTPYQLIQADLNNDQVVDEVDRDSLLANISRGVRTIRVGDQSMAWILASYEFPDPTNPWSAPFPVDTLFDDFSDPLQVNFIVLPFGDLSNSNTSNSECLSALTYESVNDNDCHRSYSYIDLTLGNEEIYGIRFTALDGNTFKSTGDILNPDFSLPVKNPTTRLVTKANNPFFGEVEDNFLAFQMDNPVTETQFVLIEYLNFDRSVRCTDSIVYNCPIVNTCLDVTLDTLLCLPNNTAGYILQLDIVIPEDNITDDVGLVRMVVTHPAELAQIFEQEYPMPLAAGNIATISEILPTNTDYAGDSLKVIITAHDGPEERICCFVDSLCIPFPVCATCVDPELSIINLPEAETPGQCCYEVYLNNNSTGPDVLDSLVLQVTPLTTGILSADFTPASGGPWVFNPASPNPIFFEFNSIATTNTGVSELLGTICVDKVGEDFQVSLFGDLIDTETGDHCITNMLRTDFCPAEDPCEELSAYTLPTPDRECCYDVFINNTYSEDPELLESLTVRLLGDGPDFSGFTSIPTAPGWQLAQAIINRREYRLRPSADTIPQGTGQQVFQYCMAGSFSTDSTYVEIAWETVTDTICTDTLAGICQNCLSVENGAPGCVSPVATPNYSFTFTNYSSIPGNTIRVISSEDQPGVISTEQTITLTEMVGPGETYSGSITIDIADAFEGGEVCFDIILEQVLSGQVPIRCCYITYCTSIPNCGDGNFTPDDGSEVAIHAYPNPASEAVMLTSNYLGTAEISLLSFTGRRMVSQKAEFSGAPLRLALEACPPGVYTVLAQFWDGHQGVRRIVIK